MNENDLRVQRTRRLLQDAFLVLASEQNFADITIRDITRNAQVGYKTFFRHYDSIEALVEAIIDKFLEEFAQVTVQQSSVVENTRYGLRLARENRRLFLAIFDSPKSMSFLKPVMAHVYQDSQQLFMTSDIPRELVGHYFATSMLSLLKWWLENESNYSEDQMVDYVMRLVIRPMQQL